MTSLLQVARNLVKRPISNSRLLGQADLARDAKEYAKAAFFYEQYLASDPGNAAIRIQCGHMYKEYGFFEQAGKHYAVALRLTPRDPDLHLQMGHFHKVSGQLDEAVAAYRFAVKLSPDNADAQHHLASILSASETNTATLTALRRSSKQASRTREARKLGKGVAG